MTLCLTIAKLNTFGPCSESGGRVRAALRKFNADKDHCFTAAEARAAGCTFDDIVWAASAASLSDKEAERRVRHWMADCATRVLHIYEKQAPADNRVRDAIKASHAYADGRISDAARDAARAAARDAARDAAWDAARDAARAAAWDAARDAARAAARDAEEKWQFDRLIAWLSDPEQKPLRLPAKPKAVALKEAA